MKTDKQVVAALDGEAMAIMPSNSSNQEIVAVITDEEDDDDEEEVERMVNALEDESKIENRLIRDPPVKVLDSDTFLERRLVQFHNHKKYALAVFYSSYIPQLFDRSTIFLYVFWPLFVYIMLLSLYHNIRIWRHHTMTVFWFAKEKEYQQRKWMYCCICRPRDCGYSNIVHRRVEDTSGAFGGRGKKQAGTAGPRGKWYLVRYLVMVVTW
jgi:hypothetical protein